MWYIFILFLFSVDAILMYLQSNRCVSTVWGSIVLKMLCFAFVMSSVNLMVFFSHGWRLSRGEHFLFAHTLFMFAYLACVLKGSARVQNVWSLGLTFIKRFLKKKG